MNKRKDIIWRIYLVYILVSGVGIAILSKAFMIQVVEGPELRARSVEQSIFPLTVESERGNVYSEDGRLLSTSLPYFELRMDFRSDAMHDSIFNANADSLAIYMARHFGDKTREEYLAELNHHRQKGSRYHLIKRKLTYPELQDIKTWPFFREGRMKSGMISIQQDKRVMPFGRLAQRTIGYVRDDGRYKVGVEGWFDEELAGTKGQILVQKIAGGTLMPIDDKQEIASQPGKDIYTTIDVNLQDIVENALLSGLEKHKAENGCAILMEVETGKIKAVANLGLQEEGFYVEDYNYAVGRSIEPGSTFKLATIMALLEDGLVETDDIVDLEGGRKEFYSEVMRDAEKPSEDLVTVKRAFAISSNVAFAKLAYEHYHDRKQKFYDHLLSFGLNQKTGVTVNGEPLPIINDVSTWSGVSLPWMAVGYELSLTPLQLLTFYNGIANDGKVMRPYLVNSVNEIDQRIRRFQPEVLQDHMCSQRTLRKARELLEEVVLSGTASYLYNENKDHFSFAGKTGTAKIAGKDGYGRYYHASYAGYFPAGDPKYSCIVLISKPKSGMYYGSVVAAPVFKEIAAKVYARSSDMHLAINASDQSPAANIPLVRNARADELDYLYNLFETSHHGESGADYLKCRQKNNSVRCAENPVVEGLVPDVRGMGLRDALYTLENAGYRVNFSGKGRVKTQSIRYGTPLRKGGEVKITLG